MSKILVTGGAQGLGACISHTLIEAGHDVIVYDLIGGHDVLKPEMSSRLLREAGKPFDILINNAALNGINWLEDVPEEQFDAIMSVNVKGIFKMSQYLLSQLTQTKGTILNITSNAAHNPMRCSLAYNCSKAASEMATKQLARELTIKNGITVFGVAPNKLADTEMSRGVGGIDDQVMATRGWTAAEAMKYQLDGLITKKETNPKMVAEFIAFLLQDKEHHFSLSGCTLNYGL